MAENFSLACESSVINCNPSDCVSEFIGLMSFVCMLLLTVSGITSAVVVSAAVSVLRGLFGDVWIETSLEQRPSLEVSLPAGVQD